MHNHVSTCARVMVCCAGIASAARAQAPSSAQVWDVRFVVDSAGAFAAGPAATAVGITIMARVGILPNTSASGTNNLGVNRVGGAGSATSGFRVTFTDPLAASVGAAQGTVQRGNTADIDGRNLLDTNGLPLTGLFAPFRGSLNPQLAPDFHGSNTDPGNGLFSNPATGGPMLFNLLASATGTFERYGPLGVAPLPTDPPSPIPPTPTPVYRMYYLPNRDIFGDRAISIQVTGMTARYAHTINGSNLSLGFAFPIPNQSIAFVVPGPNAAVFALLATFAGVGFNFRRRSSGFGPGGERQSHA